MLSESFLFWVFSKSRFCKSRPGEKVVPFDFPGFHFHLVNDRAENVMTE